MISRSPFQRKWFWDSVTCLDSELADFILQIHYVTCSWKHCSVMHLMQDLLWNTCTGIIDKCEQVYIVPASSLWPLNIWATSAKCLEPRFSPLKSVHYHRTHENLWLALLWRVTEEVKREGFDKPGFVFCCVLNTNLLSWVLRFKSNVCKNSMR